MGLVKVESSDGITTITMTRADKRNALSQALCDELYEAYRAFEAGGDQVAILQADGPAFCVGADLKEPPSAMWKAVPDVSHKLTKPVIAATQGWVIGGALPAAVAVSTLDISQPAMADDNSDYYEHWALTHFLLDGHHKLEAAAATGRPLQLLALVAADASLAGEADIRRLLRIRAQDPRQRP